MMDAGRMAEELHAEQEHSQNLDRQRKGYEQQIKEMQARLDEAEASALKGGKRMLAKLDQRVRELESELADENRRHAETQKNLRNKDRRVRELQFQVDEDKKSNERMYDLEQLAAQNLGKYRQLQHMLEDAEERADMAENSLAKMRH
uniref:Paramyosin n=1 Tax=Parascaris equorum TaxID=6256 RepID=A0A914SGI4_PAREQ